MQWNVFASGSGTCALDVSCATWLVECYPLCMREAHFVSADGASFLCVRAGFACVACRRDIVMFGIWFGVGGVNFASCIITQRLFSDILILNARKP